MGGPASLGTSAEHAGKSGGKLDPLPKWSSVEVCGVATIPQTDVSTRAAEPEHPPGKCERPDSEGTSPCSVKAGEAEAPLWDSRPLRPKCLRERVDRRRPPSPSRSAEPAGETSVMLTPGRKESIQGLRCHAEAAVQI